MKKISIIILIAFFFGACQPEESNEDIKNKIFEYKEKIKSLEKEIDNSKTVSNTEHTNVKVKVLKVKKTQVKHFFTVTGGVRAENMAYISPEMNGQIKHIYVKEGQHVKRGKLLVALNSDVLKSSILELKTGLNLAKIMYDKQKSLWEQKIGKEVDYLSAKNKKESLEAKLATVYAQIRMSKIYAPFYGFVDAIYSKKGEMATPGRKLIDFVNLNTMEVGAEISEKYLPYIKKGDIVDVKFPTYPNIVKKTKISRIGNIINPSNRTFKVFVKIENKDKKIKPNMIAELVVTDYEGEDFTVPSIIIKKDQKGKYVFVATKKGARTISEKRYVKTGINIEEKTVIMQGISSNENVIVDGYNLVNSGMKIQIVK